MAYTYISESDALEQYDAMLDECYPEVFGLLPSRILKECDPIQYNCGFTDWLDAMELTTDEDEANNEEE